MKKQIFMIALLTSSMGSLFAMSQEPSGPKGCDAAVAFFNDRSVGIPNTMAYLSGDHFVGLAFSEADLRKVHREAVDRAANDFSNVNKLKWAAAGAAGVLAISQLLKIFKGQ